MLWYHGPLVWEQGHIKQIYSDPIFHSYGKEFAYILMLGLCVLYRFFVSKSIMVFNLKG